jgi:hypothetical protein
MRLMIKILLGLLFIFVSGSAVAAVSASGTFVTVTGTVKIENQKGHHSRLAQVGSVVVEGQRVVTDKDSSAVLQFFDGSQLTIKPSTDFWLSKLQKPSDTDKILQFKMFAGSLFAKVTKLASSNSSFEIEAGGVVCGVRGTEFSMSFNADTKTLTLTVLEGTVFSDIDGKITPYGVGSQVTFVNGQFQGITSGPGSPNTGNDKGGNNITLTDLENGFGGLILVNQDNIFNDANGGGSNQSFAVVDVPDYEIPPSLLVDVDVPDYEIAPSLLVDVDVPDYEIQFNPFLDVDVPSSELYPNLLVNVDVPSQEIQPNLRINVNVPTYEIQSSGLNAVKPTR